MLIVGDIGGEYDALVRIARHHDGRVVLVGDLNDRGSRSREVIEWAMKNERYVTTLHSNHGHLFTDFYDGVRVYDNGDFMRNGGYQTLVSYGMPVPTSSHLDLGEVVEWTRKNVPKSHIEFLKTRRVFIETPQCVVSHAPMPESGYSEKVLDEQEIFDWVWNRQSPIAMDKWQIFGHNSNWGFVVNNEDQWVCLDDSRAGKLTAMEWPSMKTFQEPFVNPKFATNPDVEAF